MKYTININQKAIIDLSLDIDVSDAAIFEFISDFINSRQCQRIETFEGIYFWISHQLIIDGLPLLGIRTTRGIMKRIDKLIHANLIEKHPNCKQLKRTYYQLGVNYDLVKFSQSNKNEKAPLRTKVHSESEPLFQVTTNKSSEYKTINDSSISNKRGNDQRSPPSLFPDLDSDKTTMFKNSFVKDFQVFEKQFSAAEFEPVDINYYYQTVKDWSETKPKIFRTSQGWLATARRIMRDDNQKGKLITLNGKTKIDLMQLAKDMENL